MVEFVTGTCDVTGELSARCVVSHWIAGREQFVHWRESGWKNYTSHVVSGLMRVETHVSEEVINGRHELNIWLARLGIAGIIFSLVFVMLKLAISDGLLGALSYSPLILSFFGLLYIGFRSLFSPRYPLLNDFIHLETKLKKRVAYSLSERVATKKARSEGCSIVWHEAVFREKWPDLARKLDQSLSEKA